MGNVCAKCWSFYTLPGLALIYFVVYIVHSFWLWRYDTGWHAQIVTHCKTACQIFWINERSVNVHSAHRNWIFHFHFWLDWYSRTWTVFSGYAQPHYHPDTAEHNAQFIRFVRNVYVYNTFSIPSHIFIHPYRTLMSSLLTHNRFSH